MRKIRNSVLTIFIAFFIILGVSAGVTRYIIYDMILKPAEVMAIRPNSQLPTLIIDPGHGGDDGGAVSVTGKKESEINLDISLKIDEIMGLFGVPVILTRSSEEIVYPDDAITVKERKVADQKARVQIINCCPNAFVISIHQNKYTSPSPFGAQVLYGKTEGSIETAQMMQSLLIEHIDKTNYRTASPIPDDIYIFKKINCPSILIECGFLSNPGDAASLEDGIYQLKLAAVISGGYLSNQTTVYNTYGGNYEI